MSNRSGFLTIYSADGGDIYGEFADGTWEVEETDGGPNHLFTGTASEGTMDTFRRLNAEGVDRVSFTFEEGDAKYRGEAQLLAPEDTRIPGQAWIRIETGAQPATA